MFRRPTVPPTHPSGSLFGWDPSVLERAAAELAAYVGPVARAVVERACDVARTPEELYDRLSREIPSARDRDAFRRSAMASTGTARR